LQIAWKESVSEREVGEVYRKLKYLTIFSVLLTRGKKIVTASLPWPFWLAGPRARKDPQKGRVEKKIY
jgi:hypothetical protein